MYATTIIRVLPLLFILFLTQTCMAQDWGHPLEASTAPTDYQAILEKNLTTYTPPANVVTRKTNLATYEHSLSQKVQTIGSTPLITPNLKAQNWGPTTITTVMLAHPEGLAAPNQPTSPQPTLPNKSSP